MGSEASYQHVLPLFNSPPPQPKQPHPEPVDKDPFAETALEKSDSFIFKGNYDDYSEISNYIDASELFESNEGQEAEEEPKKKIFFLPSIYHGPVLLYFQKYYLNNGDVELKPLKSSSQIVLDKQASHLSANSAMPGKKEQEQEQLLDGIDKISNEMSEFSQACFEKSKALEAENQIESAIEELKKGLEHVEQNTPEKEEEKTEYHYRLGECYIKLQKINEAVLEHYSKALESYQKQPLRHTKKILEINEKMGRIYETCKQYALAHQHYSQALQIKRSIYPEEDEEILTSLRIVAQIEYNTGHFRQAAELFGEALHINKALYGYNQAPTADLYHSLALSLFHVQQYSLWLDYHNEAFKIMKELQLSQKQDFDRYLKTFMENLDELVIKADYDHDLALKAVGILTLMHKTQEQADFIDKVSDIIGKKNANP